jgi:hypothetical protein
VASPRKSSSKGRSAKEKPGPGRNTGPGPVPVPAPAPTPAPGLAASLRAYLRRTSRPSNAAILALPWLLLYNAGLLWGDPGLMNGADLVTRTLFRVGGRELFFAYNGLLLAGALALWIRGRRRGKGMKASDAIVAPTESIAYAALVGWAVTAMLSDVPVLSTTSPLAGMGWRDTLVLCAGAGVHEEVVFRLLLLSGLVAALDALFGRAPFTASALGLLLSAAIFASAHHILGGEPWQAYAFLYRFCAGLVFGGIFLLRGFGVAVWAHAVYDVFVLMA